MIKDLLEKMETQFVCTFPADYKAFMLKEAYKSYMAHYYDLKVGGVEYGFNIFFTETGDYSTDLYLFNQIAYIREDIIVFGKGFSGELYVMDVGDMSNGSVYVTCDAEDLLLPVASSFTEFLNKLVQEK